MIRHGTLALAILLAACGGTSEQPAAAPTGNAAPVATPSSAPPPLPAPSASASATSVTASVAQGIISCSVELGAAAATKLANQCRSVSPATRPPCNGANSCAMIRAEIARSCSVIDDGTPVPGCPAKPGGARAAAEVIRIYYAAIAARDYGTAWQLWDDDGARSGKTLPAFEQGFATTASSTVDTGTPGAVEGAAGSSYVTIPVTVRATLRDGTRQQFGGSYVLRNSNQPRSQGWRLYSAALKPARSAAIAPPATRLDDARNPSIPTTLNARWAPAFANPDRRDPTAPTPD